MSENAAEPDDAVIVDCDFAEPAEKVWRALTDPALRAVWLGEEAKESAVVEEEPGRRMRLLWQDEEGETTVTFTLTETPSGTHLRLVHDGFAEAMRRREIPRVVAIGYPLRRRRPRPAVQAAWRAPVMLRRAA